MTPSQQVPSLELSSRLKELGVKQESLFIWFPTFSRPIGIREEEMTVPFWSLTDKSGGSIVESENIAAFTVAELYELLYSNGICDMLLDVEPEKLADHLAKRLCTKLETK